MMAVICFCLRPSAPAKFEGRAHKQTVAFRQLGSYIWVSPPENPQGLGYFTFLSHHWPGKKRCVPGYQGGKPELARCELTATLPVSVAQGDAPELAARFLKVKTALP